jgi:hypothetical protein
MATGRSVRVVRYAGLGIVFVASGAAAWFLPVSETFKGIAAIPGIAAMCSALMQLWREERAHERAQELLFRQQDFALAAASHMADTAYDKHVAFCEAYIARTNQGLGELMRDGPSKGAWKMAGDLMDIRIRHATWLTTEIEAELIPFEAALGKIGASEMVLPTVPVGERRSQLVSEIYDAFSIVIGAKLPATDDQKAITTAKIIDHLRDVLGTKALTTLRQATTRVALRRLLSAPGESGH